MGAMNQTRWRRSAVACAGAAVLSLISACAGSAGAGSAGGGDDVTLTTDVFFYGGHVPFMAGIAQGFYKKHGLNISLNTGDGSGTTLQLLAAGHTDFGYVDGGALVRGVSKGEHVEMVAGMVEQSPFTIISRTATNIVKPADLDGKTGGFTPGSANEVLFPAFAKINHIDTKSIHTLQGSITTRDGLFLQGRTQFTFGETIAQVPEFTNKCKCQLNVMSYAKYGINLLSNGIAVSDSYAKSHAKTVREFVAATIEAINFSVAHPAQAVDDFVKVAGSQDTLPKSVVAAQWAQAEKLLHTPVSKHLPVGCMAPADATRTVSVMERYAGVAPGSVNAASAFTNQYLPSKC